MQSTSFIPMTESTFNYHLDTLMDEIDMHPHKDELLDLMHEQMLDFLTTKYEE